MNHVFSVLLPVVLIGFAMYRRVRRTIGFQKLEPGKLRFRTALFTVLGLLVLVLAVYHPVQFIGDAIGLAGGLTLGYFGIRHLRFEKREQGWFYRTHATVEAIVLVLFIGRIAYRVIETMLAQPGALSGTGVPGPDAGANPYGNISRDPITSSVIFVLISYYLLFFTHLLRKNKELKHHIDEEQTA
jgi:hypothetical protein